MNKKVSIMDYKQGVRYNNQNLNFTDNMSVGNIIDKDEMMDVASHKEREVSHRHGIKYRTLIILGLGIVTVAAYYYLLGSLNVALPE